MRVSRAWIQWAHIGGSEDGQPLACRLIDLAEAPGRGAIEISDPALIAELVDVAELYVGGDTSLDEMGPWWRGQPRKVVSDGQRELRCIAKGIDPKQRRLTA